MKEHNQNEPTCEGEDHETASGGCDFSGSNPGLWLDDIDVDIHPVGLIFFVRLC